MPELPEIEIIRRTIEDRLKGQRLEEATLKVTGKTAMVGAEHLPDMEGQRLEKLERFGKMLALEFDGGQTLLQHLMLIGRLALYKGASTESPDTRIGLRFEGDQHLEVRFVALRDLALLSTKELRRYPPIAKLGPDALDITARQFSEVLQQARGPVKDVFLEQKYLAGVGNAYADEILFEAKMYPLRPAAKLDDEETTRLHGCIGLVLLRAIEAGAAKEYIFKIGNEAGLTRKFDQMRVHDREGKACPNCGETVEKIVRSGRGTFFCPHCQK